MAKCIFMTKKETLEEIQFEALIKGLIDHNYGTCDDFISPQTVDGLVNNIQKSILFGSMKPSGLGNKATPQQNKKIRGDKINWIEAETENAFELTFLKKIESFILYLNNTCYTSIKSFETHYSNYNKGRFYKRHLDQFKDEKGRQFSIVLYLNSDWKKEDGGLHSLYPEGKETIIISPLGGRIVLFRSNEMEHEVHPSLTRDRNSIACWLKNTP